MNEDDDDDGEDCVFFIGLLTGWIN